MDISDIEPAGRDGAPSSVENPEPSRWPELVGALGAEIASPLTAALERIGVLTTTGRIDRQGLRALREEVETARQIGIASQQLARLASGRIRQSHERIDLAQMLDGVLTHRARPIHAGHRVRPRARSHRRCRQRSDRRPGRCSNRSPLSLPHLPYCPVPRTPPMATNPAL